MTISNAVAALLYPPPPAAPPPPPALVRPLRLSFAPAGPVALLEALGSAVRADCCLGHAALCKPWKHLSSASTVLASCDCGLLHIFI